MKLPSGSAAHTRSKFPGTVVAATVLATLSTVYFLQAEPKPPVSAVTIVKENPVPIRFGPGAVAQSTFEKTASAEPAFIDPGAPPGLETTPDQRLVMNKEIRDVFDYFLLSGNTAERALRFEKLKSHMRAKLPTSAYDEAAVIASVYFAYLNDYDKIMADEATRMQKTDASGAPVVTDETDRYRTRIMQISQLRQGRLGVKISQLWYGDEEAAMQQSLNDMRQLDTNSQQWKNR